jgi:hypothetical protein
VHILLHIPPGSGRWFARNKAGWLRRCGAKRGPGFSKTRSIRGAAVDYTEGSHASELFDRNLAAVTAYLLKHCSPEVQRLFGIERRGPCELVGKRVSISQSLNRAARIGCAMCKLERT